MTTSAYIFWWQLGALLAGPFVGRAQPAATLPTTVSRYYTAGLQPVATPDSATYCSETTYRDSLAAVTRVFYPCGRLKQYVPFLYTPQYVLHGTISSWYEDGQMQTKEDYVGGQRHGDLLTYYPNGGLKRREHYTRGRGSVGTCYAPNGAVVPFFIYEQLPLYPGGTESLQKELTKAVRLTSAERNAMEREAALWYRNALYGAKRSVHVELVVDENGTVADASVVRSTAPFLNAAALRAAATLKRPFVPARRDGQIVKSHYTVSIYYTLQMPYQSEFPSRYRPMRR